MSKNTRTKKAATKPKAKTPHPSVLTIEGLRNEVTILKQATTANERTMQRQRGQIVQLERENVTLAREASKLANIAETATLTAMQAADSLLVVSKDRLDGVRAEIEKTQAAIASAKALRGTNGECEACDTAGIVTGSGKDASLDTYSGGATTTLYRGC